MVAGTRGIQRLRLMGVEPADMQVVQRGLERGRQRAGGVGVEGGAWRDALAMDNLTRVERVGLELVEQLIDIEHTNIVARCRFNMRMYCSALATATRV